MYPIIIIFIYSRVHLGTIKKDVYMNIYMILSEAKSYKNTIKSYLLFELCLIVQIISNNWLMQ